MLEIPKEFNGLRAALGDEVSDMHFVARALSHNLQHSYDFVRALNDRYTRVFANDRLEWEGDRFQHLSKALMDPIRFLSRDAEVQTAATLLTHNNTRLRAQSEGDLEGERKCDFLLLSPRIIEIEVCLLGESDAEQESDRIERSILNRLEVLQKPQNTFLTLRLRRVRDDKTQKLLLDPAAEKQLVRAVERALGDEDWGNLNIYVTLSSDRKAEVWRGRKSLFGELASVEIRKATAKLPVVAFSRMKAPGGREEARKALQRKRHRKQCTGAFPWVIVLDSSQTTFRFEEMSKGAKDFLRNSKKTSAVVIQQRKYTTPGFGFSPNDHWWFVFRSTMIINTKAEHSILSEESALFEASELKEL